MSLHSAIRQQECDSDGCHGRWISLGSLFVSLANPPPACAIGKCNKGSRLKQDGALKAPDTVETASATPEPGAAGTAISNVTAIHQGGTIQDMVERLSQRLKNSGSDPEGWLMLGKRRFQATALRAGAAR